MKSKLMTALLLNLCIALAGITIEVQHYGYQPGKTRKFKQGAWNQSSTDLSSGTGKNWNFAMPTTGFVHNSYFAANAVPGFGSANLRNYYDQSINGYANSGNVYYQDNGTDLLQIGYTGSPNLIWNPPVPTGLPHYPGKTWQGNHSWAYGSYAISGEVISEGVLTTALGSFEALCVRYHYSTSSLSYDCYQWETLVYGITAYSNTLNGGMLYVLEEAEPSVASYPDEYLPHAPTPEIRPNPIFDKAQIRLDLQSEGLVRLEFYNLRGQLLQNQSYPGVRSGQQNLELELDRSALGSGVYFLKIITCDRTYRKRLLLR